MNYLQIPVILGLSLAACSPIMEATRPDPIDMKQFVIGESRLKVLAAVGSPLATAKGKDSDESCDLYKLYTRGPDGGGKAVIAAGEIVADVFTLGLTEVIFTPVEAGTRNTKHAVTFCYSPDDKLASIDQSDGSAGE